jgi:regulatory protein
MRADQMKSAKLKAGRYCAYQERTQQEVRDKLYSLGLHRDEVEDVLTQLITENFVNEERFAKSYALGKFRLKHWGRVKIAFELKRKNITPYCIREALAEIAEDEYLAGLHRLIEKKLPAYSGTNNSNRYQLAQFLINKGYESDLVWGALKNPNPDVQ